MDCLRKSLSADKEVEFLAIDATELVREAVQRTQAWPPAAIHLGQALMGSILLMSITTKESSSKLSLNWKVDGPFGDLYVECDELGNTRGTVSTPRADIQDLHTKLGEGLLQVRRTIKNTATGIVYAKGDVCQDLLAYLQQSEQRNCALNLWVNLQWSDYDKENPIHVQSAYGYLLDLLPSSSPERQQAKAFFWETRLQELGGLSKWKFEGDPTLSILKTISDESNPNEIYYQAISFHCNCSEERAKRALSLVNKHDGIQESVVQEEVRCEFCGKVYRV